MSATDGVSGQDQAAGVMGTNRRPLGPEFASQEERPDEMRLGDKAGAVVYKTCRTWKGT